MTNLEKLKTLLNLFTYNGYSDSDTNFQDIHFIDPQEEILFEERKDLFSLVPCTNNYLIQKGEMEPRSKMIIDIAEDEISIGKPWTPGDEEIQGFNVIYLENLITIEG